MQATANPATAPIRVPGTSPATALPSTVSADAVQAAFAPEIEVLQRCAAWEQIVVEDESSFDSI